MTAADRRLVVNADHFGLSPSVNAGILRAHTDGIVTTASLMVRAPAAEQAVAAARCRAACAASRRSLKHQLISMHRRLLRRPGITWCPDWWRHADAIARLDACGGRLQRLRLDAATGAFT